MLQRVTVVKQKSLRIGDDVGESVGLWELVRVSDRQSLPVCEP